MTATNLVMLYGRTLRNLRPRQLIYLPIRRVQRYLPSKPPVGDGRLASERLAPLAAAISAWGPGDLETRIERAESVLAGRFSFLNHTETLQNVDWSYRYVSHLWNYNLHYFDYALDLAWAFRCTGRRAFVERLQELAASWMTDSGTTDGDGWEPYPLSLRVINWLYALLLIGDALESSFVSRFSQSIYSQLKFLRTRLEYHIGANHLQKNLQALVIGGMAFEGTEAAIWRQDLLPALWTELDEQVLPDGTHYERSPMYHSIALADFLQTISLLRSAGFSVPADIGGRVREMSRAQGALSRSNGQIYLFNDAAHGIAPSTQELSALAELVLGQPISRPVGSFTLPDAGYFGFNEPYGEDSIIVDCGEPGPTYQPGHAHCDVLSYELDVGGRAFIVDSGVSGYDGDIFREYARSTRAHNTVTIAGREQSEIWGTFRVARRATVVTAHASQAPNGYDFWGAYHPYFDREVLHERHIQRRGSSWTISDRVRGANGSPLQSYIHFHPDIRIEGSGDKFMALSSGSAARVSMFGVDSSAVLSGERHPAQGWYCPEFGKAVPAPVLELLVDSNNGREFGYTIEVLSGV